MPTAGAFNGNLVLLNVGGTPVGCSKDLSWSGTNGEIDATCKDNDGAEQTLLGQQGSTFNLSGLTVFDATYGFDELLAAWKDRTTVTIRITTGVTGDTYVEFSAVITTFNWNNNVNSPSEWDISGKSTGAITTGVES
jgi:hypothetical protein